MADLILVVHNVRSAHNVGSLFRTAAGLGLNEVVLTGYTPYPASKTDQRLPHIAAKAANQISKTALGTEQMIKWRQADDITKLLDELRQAGYQLAALEQASESVQLGKFKPPAKLALLVGNEVEGLDNETLKRCEVILEIPMRGRKESFNVAVAAGMALYQLTSLDRLDA
ncbi:MAG TPA: TrmH family RNA methyltransferase [Candidatus Saccharimonadales bacterium]|nr:TrmH family RNA methyltransferase [Candidatus Saccharimonadales bacterium]